MRRAAEHYSCREGEIKYRARLCRTVDIAIGYHRYPRIRTNRANGFVLGIALIKISARAAVHGDGANAGSLLRCVKFPER